MSSPEIRRLAARIAALEAAEASRSPQLAHTALEDGAIREFDLEGTPVAQYGKQYDDTHVAVSLSGPTPPTPSTPLVVGVPGGLQIGWDGLYADDPLTVSPMDWARLDITVGPVGMDPIATPPVTAIVSPRGGNVFVPAAPGDWDVLFVARTQSGKASAASLVVTATALESGGATEDAVARAAAQQAINDAAAANNLAQQAQATADAATVVFRQSTAPTSGMVTNDLWIDSDDGLLYAYNGSTWVLSADQRIGTLVTSNATKVTIFAQTSQPPTTGRTIGDLWIDTDDGNRLYDWSGSWTARALGAAAISATAADLGGLPRIITGAGNVSKQFLNPLSWGSNAQNLAQSIVITTPIVPGSRMCLLKLKGYNYIAGRSDIDLTISFYAWQALPGTPFVNQVASNNGPAKPTVRLALNAAGQVCIILTSTEANAYFQFPKIAVTEANITTTVPPDSWMQGWSAALVDEANLTTTAGLTNITAVTQYDPGVAAAAANTLAQQAQTTAAGKITVYRQSSAPVGTFVVGDLWLDSDDGLVYYASTTAGAWTLHSDQRISAVVTSNASKTTVFAQTSAPPTTGRTIGDLWIDTDDGNKIYDWSGSWTVRALGASAISATARQLGATTVYRQSAAPASGMVTNDLWIDSDDGLVYVWAGSWLLSADQRIGTLVTSNATKVTIFVQTSQPPTTGRTLGDLWLDSDDSNKIYDWSGSAWTLRTLGAGAISATARQLGATTVYRQATAPAASGLVVNDLWIDTDDGVLYAWSGSTWDLSADQRIAQVAAANNVKVSAFTQASAPTATGRTNGDIWIDTASGNKINVWNGSSWQPFVLGGTALAADAIDGKTITGALIRSASGGARWELSTGVGSNKLYGYTNDAASGPGMISIDTASGTISLQSPDYSVAGDGSGAARLIVGGNKAGAYSTVDAKGQAVSLTADQIVNLTAGVAPNQSTIQIFSNGAGNRRINASAAEQFYADAVTFLTLAQLNSARDTIQSKIELANGLIALVTAAASGMTLNGRRMPRFAFGTITGNSSAGGLNQIPHDLGVKPTFVVCVNQNSGRYTACDITNSTSTTLDVYTRVLTTAGAPVSASASQTIMWLAIHANG